ncbi:MAG: Flp pilus assembly complex ATPase component TadA [Nitrospira sp.]|nr:Flp pilus assembly complex ATPase component TadA [Nitrospira sp.]
MVRLRPYQEKWLERILSARGKVLVVGATGSGKTVVAAALMNRLAAEGKRVLFVCISARTCDAMYRAPRGVGVSRHGRRYVWCAIGALRPIQVASLLSLKCGAMSGSTWSSSISSQGYSKDVRASSQSKPWRSNLRVDGYAEATGRSLAW